MTEPELRAALKQSMRDRDSLRSRVLRNVLAAIKNKAIETRSEPGDAEIMAILKREAKQCGETLDFARKAGREDTVAEHEQVLAVLAELLPSQMDEAELRAAIAAIVEETGASAMGAVMKELGQRHAGSYDGKMASRLAAEAVNK